MNEFKDPESLEPELIQAFDDQPQHEEEEEVSEEDDPEHLAFLKSIVLDYKNGPSNPDFSLSVYVVALFDIINKFIASSDNEKMLHQSLVFVNSNFDTNVLQIEDFASFELAFVPNLSQLSKYLLIHSDEISDLLLHNFLNVISQTNSQPLCAECFNICRVLLIHFKDRPLPDVVFNFISFFIKDIDNGCTFFQNYFIQPESNFFIHCPVENPAQFQSLVDIFEYSTKTMSFDQMIQCGFDFIRQFQQIFHEPFLSYLVQFLLLVCRNAGFQYMEGSLEVDIAEIIVPIIKGINIEELSFDTKIMFFDIYPQLFIICPGCLSNPEFPYFINNVACQDPTLACKSISLLNDIFFKSDCTELQSILLKEIHWRQFFEDLDQLLDSGAIIDPGEIGLFLEEFKAFIRSHEEEEDFASK